MHAPKCSYKQDISLNKVRHAVALGHLFTFWPLKSSLLTGASAAQYPRKSEVGHKKKTLGTSVGVLADNSEDTTLICVQLWNGPQYFPAICNSPPLLPPYLGLCSYVWYLTSAVQNVTSNDSATAALSGPIYDRKPGNETLKTKAIPVMAFQRKWHKHRSRIRTVIKQGDRNRYSDTLTILTITQMRPVCCEEVKLFCKLSRYSFLPSIGSKGETPLSLRHAS